MLKLNLKTDNIGSLAYLHTKERQISRFPRDANPCRQYAKEEDYNSCYKNTVWSIANDNMNCTIPGKDITNKTLKFHTYKRSGVKETTSFMVYHND